MKVTIYLEQGMRWYLRFEFKNAIYTIIIPCTETGYMQQWVLFRMITQAFLLAVLVFLTLIPSFSADPVPVAPGDTVFVYYSLSFPGGPVFETNVNESPYSFILGSGAVIKGFDAAIRGMVKGETKTVIIPPEDAYGQKNESLIRNVPLLDAVALLNGFNKTNVSISLIPGYPGPVIEYLPPVGKRERYLFTNITNETVTLDTNKPLVGRDLQFEITLDQVITAKEDTSI